MSSQESGLALVIRHTGQVFPLTRVPVTIGRHAENTIVLSDPQASRRHASISWQAGAYVIQDLGSANGTYVNERRISRPQPLRAGYVVRVGNTFFEMQRVPAAREGEKTMAPSPMPPGYPPPDSGQRSVLPVVLALLAAGVVVVGLMVAAILLLAGGGKGEPTVAIQSPLEGDQIAVGQEVILQATATGARDISRVELKINDVLVAIATSPDPEGIASLTASQRWTFGQAGLHVLTAVAYTAGGQVSEVASQPLTILETIVQVTPSATPSATPTTELPPTETATMPATVPPPTVPLPDTATPTSTSTATSTPTPTPTSTATPTQTPTPTPTSTNIPTPVVEFWADSTSIAAGSSTFLRWHVEHVLEIYLDGSPVTGPDGSREVNPAVTTTYELRAVHAGGETTRLVTITVTPVSQTWLHPIQVSDNRQIYHLRLTGPGEIRVRAEWSGPQSDLTLIINGPGQVGYYARRDGASPLEVAYNVTSGDWAAGDHWRVTLASFGSDRADGSVRISYPSGSSMMPFVDSFVVDQGYGSATSVIVLRGAGAIQAQATWSGSPGSMALIINGPGQVGYYARQDGPSPLSVGYSVTASDLAPGDIWRVSLTSFSPPDAEGNISLTYP